MPKAISLTSNLVHIPPNMAIAGWDFDVERILEFCKHFGIKWDIRIRFTSGKQTWGTHCCKHNGDGNWYHSITISQVRDMDESNRTFLHELCHAIQNERDGDPWNYDKDYHRYNHSGTHYQLENPYETEAVDFASDNASEWGLLY